MVGARNHCRWQVVVGPRNQCWCLVVQLQQGLLRLWLTRQPTKCWMKLLENLNKDDPPAASGAGVKSVGATQAAGSGTAMGLSPEQRRWLVNAAEAMRTGQAVAPLALLANAPEVQTLVPVGGAGQRPGFVKLDTKEVMTRDIMHGGMFKVSREGMGFKVLVYGVTIRDKDLK